MGLSCGKEVAPHDGDGEIDLVDLRRRIAELEAENVELRAGLGKKPKDKKSKAVKAMAAEVERERDDYWFVLASKLRSVPQSSKMSDYRWQQLRADGWLVQLNVEEAESFEGLARHHTLTVSHRWEDENDPDPEGVQMIALRDFLLRPENRSIRFVWVDWLCLPQNPRTDEEQAEFDGTLVRVNRLYLGTRVLILQNVDFRTRFWTQCEAWLSLQMGTPLGLRSAPEDERRCHIVPIHNAQQADAQALLADWVDKSATEVKKRLESKEVKVTNKGDKPLVLGKVLKLDEDARRVLQSVKWFELRADEEKALRLAQERREFGIQFTPAVAETLHVHGTGNRIFEGAPQPVNVVAICGKVRTGKSYLMNALADSQVFGVSARAKSFTRGVRVGSRLFTPRDGFRLASEAPDVAFVDMEGQGDKSIGYDVKLAKPLLLLTKVLLLNIICPHGPSRDELLAMLAVTAEAAGNIIGKTGQLFGHLHIVLRDCMNDEAVCRAIIFDKEDFAEENSEEQQAALEERNRLRVLIADAYESVTVWCLPKLVCDSSPPDTYWKSVPGYVKTIERMRTAMRSQLSTPKLLNGTPLTGQLIGKLMSTVRDHLDGDVIDLSRLIAQVASTAPPKPIGGDNASQPQLGLPSSMQLQAEPDEGESCVFWFLLADQVREFKGQRFPKFQDLQRTHPGMLVQRNITLQQVCIGAYVEEYCVVAHRWMLHDDPDPDGAQFQEIQRFLRENQGIKYLVYEYSTFPQGERTAEEMQNFKMQLRNVFMLYLGCTVLILLDLSFVSRFWTQFEAWLSMQFATPRGLKSAVGTKNERHHIVCILNAAAQADMFTKMLIDQWAHKTPQQAFEFLSKPDVTVTNQGDKDSQLSKLRKLEETVQGAFKAITSQQDKHIQTTADEAARAKAALAAWEKDKDAVAGPNHELKAELLRSEAAAAAAHQAKEKHELAITA